MYILGVNKHFRFRFITINFDPLIVYLTTVTKMMRRWNIVTSVSWK